MSNKPNHPVDLIVTMISEVPYGSAEGKSIVSVLSQEGLVIEVPHNYFVYGAQQMIIENCDLMV